MISSMAWRIAARRLATQLPAWSAGAAEGCCSSGQSTARQAGPAWFRSWYGARSFASLPAHVEMQMPSLSPTMSKGNISAWKKKEGEEVVAGDILCDVETDKATMEWEAQDDGFLAKILVGDGAQDIDVGTPVAIMVESADSVAAFADYKPGGGGKPPGGEPSSGKDPSKGKPETPPPKDAGPQGGAEGGEEASGGGGGGNFPAHTVMGLPALSPTMQQGNIANWNKKAGEAFAAGDSLADIETDKATMTWEAQDEGFVAKLLVEAGSADIQVGQPVLVVVEEEGDVAAFESFTADDAAGKKAPPQKKDAAKEQPPDEGEAAQKTEAKAGPLAGEGRAPPPAPARASGDRVAASPYAKKLAREAGVDYSQAKATGPGGRIVAADVQKLIESGGGKADQAAADAGTPEPAADAQEGGEWTDAKTSQIRRITAQRLLESKTTIPHYYLTVGCRVDQLLAMRGQLNARLAAEGKKLSVNDFIIKASALAMKKVPEANASWHGDFIRQYHDVNVSVAVQTPAGLQVPVLRGADRMGLTDISSGIKDIATKAKDGKLKPDQSQGGTFTVSNLGMFGITQFSAVVNPPQACILAVGGTDKRVVLLPTGGFGEASIMAVTLSCDHRIVDGAIGANWLAAFRGYIEDPTTMLL